MWTETDIRPLLGSISTPTAVLYSSLDRQDEEAGSIEAGLIPTELIGVATPSCRDLGERAGGDRLGDRTVVASVRHEEAELDRMLATVLFTDVVGSTDKACQLVTPAGRSFWKGTTGWCARSFQVSRRRGQDAGDGLPATFDGPARAVKCAQGICEAVRQLGLEVRAGCHTGEIEQLGTDIRGVAVHIGARVGALAGPSEVLVTSTVKDLVAGSGLVFDDGGERRLKGVPEAWHLYALAAGSTCRKPDRRLFRRSRREGR